MSWIPLVLILFSGAAVSSELENAVRTYWDLLLKGDKAAALQYVIEPGRNAFLNRRIERFRSWTLERTETRSPDEAVVTVKLDQMITPGIYYPRPFNEIWVRQEDGWRVRVRAPSVEQFKKILSGAASAGPHKLKPGVLDLIPKQVKIHFLDRNQRGAVRIRNGLSETVHLTRCDYDKTRFELLETGESIASGQELRLVFRYIGNETEKPLKSEVRLILKRGDGEEAKEKLFTVPILYNYVSPGARGLLGLTKEKLDQLKRGEPVKPVLPRPAAPPPNLPGLPAVGAPEPDEQTESEE